MSGSVIRCRTLRVCMVAGTYPPARCGIGDYLHQLSENLAKLGIRVAIVTSSFFDTSPSYGNPRVLPVIRTWSLISVVNALRTVYSTQPDIVHFQVPNAIYEPHLLFDMLVPLVKIFRPSTKVVVTFHEPIRARRLLWMGALRPSRYQLDAWLLDAVIAVSNSSRKELQALFPRFTRIPCVVVRNASSIPVSRLSLGQLEELRVRAGFVKGTTLLSYFGFTRPGKGFEDLLEVISILKRLELPAKLLVLSELSPRDDYHKSLLCQIAQRGLSDDLVVMGYLEPPMVADYLAMSDVCIFPITEGVHPKAVSYLSAVIQGVFTVVTCREKRGFFAAENAYYASPGDIDDMVSAVQRYAGRRVPRGSFPWRNPEQVALENLQVYTRLVSREARVSYTNED